jgi:ABC-type branched-subunit amino acid transport system ATPase component
MVEIARAIVDHPRVLLLDEPTSGLDEPETEMLGETITRVRGEEHCGIMLVEHDVGFVMRNADRVIAMNLGSVIANEPPEQIRKNVAVIESYLGPDVGA